MANQRSNSGIRGRAFKLYWSGMVLAGMAAITIAVDQATTTAPPDTVKLALVHLDTGPGAVDADGSNACLRQGGFPGEGDARRTRASR